MQYFYKYSLPVLQRLSRDRHEECDVRLLGEVGPPNAQRYTHTHTHTHVFGTESSGAHLISSVSTVGSRRVCGLCRVSTFTSGVVIN